MNGVPADRRHRPRDRIMQAAIPCLGLSGQCGAAADFGMRAFAARDIGRMPMEGEPGRFLHCRLEIGGGALPARLLGPPDRSVRAQMGGVDTRSRALGEGGMNLPVPRCLP